MSVNHGTVHWNELNTRDTAAAKTYYETVCSWTWSDVPMGEGTYHIAHVGDDMVAGMFNMNDMPGMEDLPPHWLMYLAVTDVDQACAQTKATGGTVIRDPFDVPDVGRIAIVQDASGGALGLMTPSG